jgi:hypothetical protein
VSKPAGLAAEIGFAVRKRLIAPASDIWAGLLKATAAVSSNPAPGIVLAPVRRNVSNSQPRP